jgi:hypothetical protein
MDMDSTIESDETAELDVNFEDLEFSTSDLSTRLEPLHSSADHINGASAEDTKMDSQLLSTDKSDSLGLSGFASKSIDDGRSEVAEGYIWSQDLRRIVTSANKLFPAIDIFDSGGLESSQSSIIGNQNAAANEHGHGEEHDCLSRNAPLSVPGGFQEEGDVQNQEHFVASMILDDNSPIIGDEYLAASETPNMAPARFTHEEANLSALGEAIDGCFKDGFEPDLTISQLLSLFTYLQGSSSEPEELSEGSLSYWKMKEVATLARDYIEKQQHSAAVLLYKRVIINAWVVLRGVLYTDFMRLLEEMLPFSRVVKRQCYLEHELTVLQLVVTGYFKLQLSAENPSVGASRRILGVVQRLRCIHNSKSSFLREDLNRKLRSLTQTVHDHNFNGFFNDGRQYCVDRRFCDELLFHVLDLANCYSLRGEFEIARELFQLRSIPSRDFVMPTFATNHRRSRGEEWFEQHQQRCHRCQRLFTRPRVQPWDVITEAPLNTKSGDALLASEYQEGLEVQIERLCRSLFKDCKLGWLPKVPDRPAENKEVGFINLYTSTGSGSPTGSTRSYRFGVSMSDSDVPGIDLSMYMAH